MLDEQKRTVAERCLSAAIKGDFESASKIRQQAYALNPPGTIGVDWNNWPIIWETDFRYLRYLNAEDFSDMDNSDEKVQYLKAGIFVDYLFGFRDFWGVFQQAAIIDEEFRSDAVERFLQSKNWTFKSENREIIYARTKESNISAKIYLDSVKEKGFSESMRPYIYGKGEYNLGFLPNASICVVEGRRKWLETYEQYTDMSHAGIEKFPKTFQTFEKHKLLNDEKYLEWIRQYKLLITPQK